MCSALRHRKKRQKRGQNADDLVTWVFSDIEKWPDQEIYLDADDSERTLTASEVRSLVRKLIAGLRKHGITAGDSVCVVSYNTIWYTVFFLAIIGCGARLVAANPAYTASEWQHLLHTTDVKLLIAESTVIRTVEEALVQYRSHKVSIFSFDSSEDCYQRHPSSDNNILQGSVKCWQSLLHYGQSSWIRLDEIASRETIAVLLPTSGTTGMPKAAMISHRALVVQAKAVERCQTRSYKVRRLICIPQFHAFTIPLAHLLPLRHGTQVWVMRRFNVESFLNSIQIHQITEVAVVPPIVHSILCRSEDSDCNISLSSLKQVYCAGAPLTRDCQERFSKLLTATASFSQVWGMTEIGWITALPSGEQDLTGSVGRLLDGFTAKIHNPIEQAQSRFLQLPSVSIVVGEIYVRSESMMLGYLGNEDATRQSIKQGWLRTGDIGYSVNDKWYIVDREKDLIKVRAWQVSPTEIEACLVSHPAVSDAAVIGITLTEAEGEIPRAYVVLHGGSESGSHYNGRNFHRATAMSSHTSIEQDRISGLADESLTNQERNTIPNSPVIRRSQIALSSATKSSTRRPQSLPDSDVSRKKSTDEDLSIVEELLQYTATKLAKYKRLTGGIGIIEAIPRNPSGKVLRRQLRDKAMAELNCV